MEHKYKDEQEMGQTKADILFIISFIHILFSRALLPLDLSQLHNSLLWFSPVHPAGSSYLNS